MNLEKQNKKSLKYLRPEVIPLLVLIKHWSRSGQSSLIKTNEILLLLDVLHLTLTKSHKVILSIILAILDLITGVYSRIID